MGEFVTLEVKDGVGTIRLDRPPVNALNAQVTAELAELAKEVSERDDVRAVILYGGEKTFAGGADIKEMATRTYPEIAKFGATLTGTLAAIANIPKPVVAAITGYALGGGLELALTADRRIAGDNVKVGQPEIQLGVIPGAGGTQRLARLIGPSKTKDIVYTGRFVKAEEALQLGIVDQVVAPDDVYAAAHKWASQFANGPAVALRAAKAAIDGGLDTDLANGLKLESHLFAALWATEDQQNGMKSFIENGPGKATFEGK
ncbi:enoyl-CoA hydratase [Amycolatopsis mediterranei S699]|uniref:enoyl-CoA hydratase n=2 Tax=Amycolatopsis mediterranei TaxID=33910 RepID=A0A0H3D1Q4_AMYMU|nr:enoyl-CoA hydratase-related protein [Amycolatopsis mediterranei]ADJ43426.1 enoyl-CoA hydratase [Amycolatopsis mediterranei U32]AEK40129.1 enoyl-CoA hydratase [Amycolatopsis mediterranei S699]AFO75139.1 enoyl-CoA hydratase [Amycolatopsis mediterranei S699]AGT82268.1 enoyl-CoA hydratase [Amycolatopsis mediterranei RB]KDO11669.1 enoyl-CoA hydratase [Amycolatopsis mediterranei]